MLNSLTNIKTILSGKLKRTLFEYKLPKLSGTNTKYNLLQTYIRAKNWVRCNNIPGKGIIVCKRFDNLYKGIAYPEVSGYYIPSLLQWGERNLAIQYAKWLCSIQNNDGSWNDYYGKHPYVFDTGQILKGLISVYPIIPKVKDNILKGCDWIISNIQKSGKLTTPNTDCWAEETCSDLIHLYCLSPLRQAAKIFKNQEYSDAIEKVLNYYKQNFYEKLIDFHTLSHFYAYIIEGLIDIGEIEIANIAADNVIKLQKPNGAIPAYKDVDWVCSTGIFQFAIIFYKLGKKEEADKAFDCACNLQLKSGGWVGSYGIGAKYSNFEEISWCNKYFLDAFSLKLQAHFANTLELEEKVSFGTYKLESNIDAKDGRTQTMLEVIRDTNPQNLLDIGCGKGRILKHVKDKYPQIEIHGLDLDKKIIKALPHNIHGKVGSILNTGYKDEEFDLVCAIEILEHAVDIENAIQEMLRITKKGGTILIIDKNKQYLGKFAMPPWEQWFDKNQIKNVLEQHNAAVTIKENIPYDQCDGSDGLFIAWIGTKNTN
jgi:malonyl-CoA O-methyltransferase